MWLALIAGLLAGYLTYWYACYKLRRSVVKGAERILQE